MANRSCLTRVVAVATLVAGVTAAHSATYYTVTDLGTLAGPLGAAANISGNGLVAGLSTLPSGNYHAVLWNGAPVDLGVLVGDSQSYAFAVNDSGQVVGVSYDYGDLSPHAFRWQAGVLTSLGAFSPHDINNSGVVVGHTTVFNAASLWVDHPCTWSSGSLVEMATLGGHNGQAMAVNAAGQIAGQSFLIDNKTLRACVWMNGTPHDLASLAGTATAKSAATDLNDSGQVVGWSDTAAGVPHATLFQIDAGGAVLSRTDLGVLGSTNSYAHGVNNAGMVVGVSDGRAFVWQAGTMTDLNAAIASTSGWMISNAAAINDAGVIVGEAVRHGFGRAVMLTPASCLKADVNNNGKVDGADVSLFASVLMSGGSAEQTCAADVAVPSDGVVNLADVNAFVQCLLDGGCG